MHAGPFGAWLTAARASLRGEGRGLDAPCGDCVGCCMSSLFVHVAPDETSTLAVIPKRLLVRAPGRPRGHLLLGFADDYLKVVRRSHHGLIPRYKMALLLLVAIGVGDAVVSLARQTPPVYTTHLTFPFFKNLRPDLGVGYVAFVVVVLVAATNAVNLTDGLDGLAISTFGVAATAFTALTYVTSHAVLAAYLLLPHFPLGGELTVFCGALVGASLGFLWYNSYPAEIFMGDVGSLGLGGAIGTVAILIKQELLLPIVGGVFVLEALSVIIQIASFQTTGKRVFKMAPLHHHFELIGWSEPKIIIRFLIVAILFALLSLTTLKLR
jgi:phospho-N-acetylmuramoyl-pentapeptide-transferase